MKGSSYIELLISINPQIEDDLSCILFERLNCEGVVLLEEERNDDEILSSTSGTLKVFLTEESIKDIEEIKSILEEEREFLKTQGLSEDELGSWDLTFTEKENEDWSKKWKEHWDITHIGDNILIIPSWLANDIPEDKISILLDPGLAFGTGTHQTTQLCAIAMEQNIADVKGKKVADIGMGTGILAIIAKKMGADYVYGCDNDEDVIDIAIENAQKNSVECNFEFGTADLLTDEFDFICANILHNILAEIMPDLKNIMKIGGKMVLSGILEEKKDVVLEAIKLNNLELIETNYQEPWISFVVKK